MYIYIHMYLYIIFTYSPLPNEIGVFYTPKSQSNFSGFSIWAVTKTIPNPGYLLYIGRWNTTQLYYIGISFISQYFLDPYEPNQEFMVHVILPGRRSKVCIGGPWRLDPTGGPQHQGGGSTAAASGEWWSPWRAVPKTRPWGWQCLGLVGWGCCRFLGANKGTRWRCFKMFPVFFWQDVWGLMVATPEVAGRQTSDMRCSFSRWRPTVPAVSKPRGKSLMVAKGDCQNDSAHTWYTQTHAHL